MISVTYHRRRAFSWTPQQLTSYSPTQEPPNGRFRIGGVDKMRDEMDGRLWDAHGRELTDGLHRLFTGIGAALTRLHRVKWEMPWRRGASPIRGRASQA